MKTGDYVIYENIYFYEFILYKVGKFFPRVKDNKEVWNPGKFELEVLFVHNPFRKEKVGDIVIFDEWANVIITSKNKWTHYIVKEVLS